jgi:hypothetical protein
MPASSLSLVVCALPFARGTFGNKRLMFSNYLTHEACPGRYPPAEASKAWHAIGISRQNEKRGRECAFAVWPARYRPTGFGKFSYFEMAACQRWCHLPLGAALGGTPVTLTELLMRKYFIFTLFRPRLSGPSMLARAGSSYWRGGRDNVGSVVA